jgi:hypothetical protein
MYLFITLVPFSKSQRSKIDGSRCGEDGKKRQRDDEKSDERYRSIAKHCDQ